MQVQFIKKHQEAPDVWSFIFASRGQFTWIAGQSLRLEIPGAYGPIEHRFSIASAPSTGEIMVATRLSDSDYKESLAALRPGDIAQAYAIEGDFTWREHAKPHIFVAAGIGITPIHAMLAERVAQKQPLTATLLYSSHDQAIFGWQLQDWQASHPEFSVRHQNERVNMRTVLALPHAKNRLIYISGPSKMADTLGADLSAAGVPTPHILRDQFTGRLPLDG